VSIAQGILYGPSRVHAYKAEISLQRPFKADVEEHTPASLGVLLAATLASPRTPWWRWSGERRVDRWSGVPRQLL